MDTVLGARENSGMPNDNRKDSGTLPTATGPTVAYRPGWLPYRSPLIDPPEVARVKNAMLRNLMNNLGPTVEKSTRAFKKAHLTGEAAVKTWWDWSEFRTEPVQGLRRPSLRLQGQWWERLGYVAFLPHGMDPNVADPAFQGWVQVTDERAGMVLDNQPDY